MSRLFIVPTPIGNLKDITLRAIDILKDVDIVLAEDTRKTKILLDHYQIKTKLWSHHKFNEHNAIAGVVIEINAGKRVALVTDAGTPGISDPGYLLVRACLEKEIEVETLPGATAFIPALINSGIPCDRFCFEGFIPQKKGRQKKINSIAVEERTIVLYESPHRLIKTLTQLAEKLGNERKASVSRELTKIHEETVRGSLPDIINHFKDRTIKGEIVIIIEGAK